MNRRDPIHHQDPINNQDIALNWQGLPLPVSSKFAVCLTELLNTHKPTWQKAHAVTMNFRDPSYGPERVAVFILWKFVCSAEEIYGPWSI